MCLALKEHVYYPQAPDNPQSGGTVEHSLNCKPVSRDQAGQLPGTWQKVGCVVGWFVCLFDIHTAYSNKRVKVLSLAVSKDVVKPLNKTTHSKVY